MRVHDGLVEVAAAAAVRLFDDAFEGRPEHGQEAPAGADLRGVRSVSLAGRGCVEPVDCATNVLPLRYFDAVWEDLDGQRVVGDFLSIGIQLCWGWVVGRSHLLCSFPWNVDVVGRQSDKQRTDRIHHNNTLHYMSFNIRNMFLMCFIC